LNIDGKTGWELPKKDENIIGRYIFVLAGGGIWFHENKDTQYTMTCVPVKRLNNR
jgi:hypothetical protein